jgi:ubiquinone/menaquinone biosynthesis C-methylase UbiE
MHRGMSASSGHEVQKAGEIPRVLLGPNLCSDRPAYLYVPHYPNSGGYPFLEVDHAGSRYCFVGQGFFSPESASLSEITALYDHWAPRYDSDHPWTTNLGADLAGLLGCHMPHSARVLDLCCGTGSLTRAFLDRLVYIGKAPASITVVDASQRMLEQASRKLAPYSPNVFAGHVTDFQADDQVDAVILSLAVDHLHPEMIEALCCRIGAYISDLGVVAFVVAPSRLGHAKRSQYLFARFGTAARANTTEYISSQGLAFTLKTIWTVNGRATLASQSIDLV